MLLTRSSGYTVLSCYRSWGQHEEPLYFKRDTERETPCGLCSPFQTQLALHVIVSWFNHVQLLFVCLSTWQWGRSQDRCRGRAASLPLITPSLPALPSALLFRSSLSQKRAFASRFAALLSTISTSVNMLLHYCEKCTVSTCRLWLHITLKARCL